jgi:hypothetical protein
LADRTLHEAMREGAKAAALGVSAERNPHLDWPLAVAWCLGWHAAHPEWGHRVPAEVKRAAAMAGVPEHA